MRTTASETRARHDRKGKAATSRSLLSGTCPNRPHNDNGGPIPPEPSWFDVIAEPRNGMVWYGIVEFNVPLDTVYVISETGDPEQ